MKVRVETGKIWLGVACGWFMVAMCALLLWQPGFDERPRMDVTGEVVEVDTPFITSQRALDVTLTNQASRFRLSPVTFQSVLKGRVPDLLVAGAKARFTVEKEEYEHPRTPAPYRTPTVEIDAIDVSGTTVLSLDDARASYASNRLIFQVLCVLCFGGSIYLTQMLRFRLRDERANPL